jgi:hypothetical protein
VYRKKRTLPVYTTKIWTTVYDTIPHALLLETDFLERLFNWMIAMQMQPYFFQTFVNAFFCLLPSMWPVE